MDALKLLHMSTIKGLLHFNRLSGMTQYHVVQEGIISSQGRQVLKYIIIW